MKGHSMKLVGRADPRGTPEYNMTLGQARGDSVQKYLVERGVDQTKYAWLYIPRQRSS
jgi:peptidoglycan-associated lipoprotein